MPPLKILLLYLMNVGNQILFFNFPEVLQILAINADVVGDLVVANKGPNVWLGCVVTGLL